MNDDPRQEGYAGEPETKESFMTPFDVSHLRRSLKSIMKPAIVISPGSLIAEALDIMTTRRMGCVLIEENKRLCGIFTERDVLKKIAGSTIDIKTTPIGTLMTVNPQALCESDTIAYALNFMDQGGYRHIPIVSETYEPVGMVSIKDIVSYLVEHFADEILNLPAHRFAGHEAQQA
jgi:CBS domain-containing protein